MIQDFWATCACPEKQSCPEMFRCMEYTFYIQNFWSICMRLPWKTELPRYFSLYLNMYILSFRIFEQLCACLEQSWPGIFHWIEYTFYIQEFWATCMRLPWKTEGSLNLLYRIYIFYYSKVLSNLRLPWKTELPWNFHCTEIYFIIQDFWETCACPEIFQARGAPAPPPRTPMYAPTKQYKCLNIAWSGKQRIHNCKSLV